MPPFRVFSVPLQFLSSVRVTFGFDSLAVETISSLKLIPCCDGYETASSDIPHRRQDRQTSMRAVHDNGQTAGAENGGLLETPYPLDELQRVLLQQSPSPRQAVPATSFLLFEATRVVRAPRGARDEINIAELDRRWPMPSKTRKTHSKSVDYIETNTKLTAQPCSEQATC